MTMKDIIIVLRDTFTGKISSDQAVKKFNELIEHTEDFDHENRIYTLEGKTEALEKNQKCFLENIKNLTNLNRLLKQRFKELEQKIDVFKSHFDEFEDHAINSQDENIPIINNQLNLLLTQIYENIKETNKLESVLRDVCIILGDEYLCSSKKLLEQLGTKDPKIKMSETGFTEGISETEFLRLRESICSKCDETSICKFYKNGDRIYDEKECDDFKEKEPPADNKEQGIDISYTCKNCGMKSIIFILPETIENQIREELIAEFRSDMGILKKYRDYELRNQEYGRFNEEYNILDKKWEQRQEEIK